MAATTQFHGHIQLGSHKRQPKKRSYRKDESTFAPVLKAGLVGSMSLISLISIGLIPLPDTFYFITLTLGIIPGFFVICFAIGLLATTFSVDGIYCTQKRAEIAWMSGFWAGIGASIFAMFLAANGLLMINIGQSVLAQLTAGQFDNLSEFVKPNTIALGGRVLGALLIYGVIGSLLSALISSLGGLLWVKLI